MSATNTFPQRGKRFAAGRKPDADARHAPTPR
ncbi:hypothetical protein B1M_08812 [Burkholderia sp. TJI49]|nr:hypothetical protein B1M_08812 [Burkholderia sp. TJI49]